MGLIFCAAERNSSPIVLGSLWAKRERGTSGRPYTSVAGLGCLSMDGFKSPETKATVSDTSIDFSSPDHWRPEDIGNFRVAW